MRLKLSAILAICYGLIIAILEAVRNWGDWQWWPYWVIDYIMAVMLIYGGFLVLRNVRKSHLILSCAWGVSFGASYMSFWGHIENFNNPAHGHIGQTPLTYLIGLSLVGCILGFVLLASEAKK
jgi:hypothetical protein